MTDPEQDLATILAALNSAEPSPSLNRRILENLAARQATSTRCEQRPSVSRRILRPLPATAALPLAAALVFTLSLAFFFHQHHPSAPASHAVTTSAMISPARSITATSPNGSPGMFCCHSERGEEPPHLAFHHGAQRRTRPQAAALQAKQLASFPAPPLPLTPQEKLLLRVAHARNPQQSPILDPALRASLAARDSEDFQLFFAPATTVKPYEPSN